MNKVAMQVKVVLVMALCVGLQACQRRAPENAHWQVSDAHIRELPPGQSRSAVYLTLKNLGAEDRQILHVDADIAGQAQVHRHSYENGMMKMRQVSHAQIPAGGTLVFEPGGYHIMLLDITDSPAVGSEFLMTIEFDGGEPLTFPVEVLPK